MLADEVELPLTQKLSPDPALDFSPAKVIEVHCPWLFEEARMISVAALLSGPSTSSRYVPGTRAMPTLPLGSITARADVPFVQNHRACCARSAKSVRGSAAPVNPIPTSSASPMKQMGPPGWPNVM